MLGIAPWTLDWTWNWTSCPNHVPIGKGHAGLDLNLSNCFACQKKRRIQRYSEHCTQKHLLRLVPSRISDRICPSISKHKEQVRLESTPITSLFTPNSWHLAVPRRQASRRDQFNVRDEKDIKIKMNAIWVAKTRTETGTETGLG